MENKIKAIDVWGIVAIALLSFVGIVTETSMNVAYQALSHTFNIALDTTQWITAGYLLMVTVVMGTTANLFRRFNLRSIHIFGVLAFVVGDVLAMIAPNFTLLMIGRLIQAIATGVSTPAMFHSIFSKIPPAKRGLMTGIAGMVISFAPALGPTYGGYVLSILSWRAIFWFTLPLAALSLIIGCFTIIDDGKKEAEPFNYLAFVILTLAMFVWIYALSLIGKEGFTWKFWLLFICSWIIFAIFVQVNQKSQARLFDVTIFKRLPVSLNGLSYFFLQFINIGISLVIPTYVQYALKGSAFISGLVLLPGAVLGAITSPIAGILADRLGYRVPIITGGILAVIGTGLILFFQASLTPIKLIFFFMLFRLGFNLAFANTISNTSTQVERKNMADVSSIFNMIQQFAGSTGTIFLASLMALFQNKGTGSLAQRTYDGGKIDFIMMVIFAVIVLIALLTSYYLQGKKQK
ncbi:MFS transporter [Lactobacillus corticis]|uniref:Major facilitator superfamily transporter n=1 Tax=Lactobacillus corticis TaxID=2201249 RepID=A0A916QGH9_9LACO|nr:MFS transporter [Lactobacillus corticis]GFZ26559.1 major facilitator superfamily transporter [Lactobacillus corticis]